MKLRFLENPHAPLPFLWIDYHAYAGALLANGRIPWLDIAACVAWHRSAHALLRPDVVTLPVVRIIEAWVQAHPHLAVRMGSKSRLMFPIRTLLEDAELRLHLKALVAATRAAFSSATLALVIPSPRSWVDIAHSMAHGARAEAVSVEDGDSAAVYVADFLGIFGDSGLDALLLEEQTDLEPVNAAELLYSPVFNIAAHYRWDTGLRLPDAKDWSGKVAGPQFVIAPRRLEGDAAGLSLGDAFWQDGILPEVNARRFLFAQIDPITSPEKVLERLSLLRTPDS